MALEVGKSYRTKDGVRTFTILGRKKISSNGFPFIGECNRTGLISFYNYDGRNSVLPRHDLDIDMCTYCPINADSSFATDGFVKKGDIPEGIYIGYLRILNNEISTVHFINTSQL